MVLNGNLFYSSLSDQEMDCLEDFSLSLIPLMVVESCSQSETGEVITEDKLSFSLNSSLQLV